MNMTVWEWFEQRSYHHRDFRDLALPVNGVERPSTTLIFPARNVAGTIGGILTVVADLQARSCLYDVIDVDFEAGKADATFRPNQVFAVGGLPAAVLLQPAEVFGQLVCQSARAAVIHSGAR